MSQHQFLRRMPVDQQLAQKAENNTFPAPTRGLIINENESYMKPGAAVVLDNWKPTMKSIALRGGCTLWATLAETTPVISGFSYVSGIVNKMFVGNATKLYDVTSTTPAVIASGQHSGNYAASQMANQGGDWMIVVNDAGDPPLRFDGTAWIPLAHTTPANWANSVAYTVGTRARDAADGSMWKCAVAHTSPAPTTTFAADRTANPTRWATDSATDGVSWITGPTGSLVEHGSNLSYVCKYKSRLFFIQMNSMSAWYLPVNAVGGALLEVPLSGAATKGGKLLFAATWSIDAGNGLDDKLVFATDLGELLIFTGSNPSDASNWRQEGRYEVSAPTGMNAHLPVGGDLLIATIDGIVPVSAAITKGPEELELAAVTRNIKPMWREEVLARGNWPWTLFNWNEYGGIFVSWPGYPPGKQRCGVVNAATGAWGRYIGWDATCFMRLQSNMFFGTQTGKIMQADRTGYDNGAPYTATAVGGWEVFQSPSQTITWLQARASFLAPPNEPFSPQLAGTVDYTVVIPAAPPAGTDPASTASSDLWDLGLWDQAKWDAGVVQKPVSRHTGWLSIGVTGYSHAPIIQVTVAQVAKPNVELISIAGTFVRLGVTV